MCTTRSTFLIVQQMSTHIIKLSSTLPVTFLFCWFHIVSKLKILILTLFKLTGQILFILSGILFQQNYFLAAVELLLHTVMIEWIRKNFCKFNAFIQALVEGTFYVLLILVLLNGSFHYKIRVIKG